VPLQLWRRDATAAFERLSFGAEPVHSEVVDAWFIADGRDLNISNDRRGRLRWLTDQEQLAKAQTTAERAQADAERAQADAERAQADAERERQARLELEQRLRELERQMPR
jgi:uncharacterized protein YaiL (DUF2058 family)